MTDAWRLNDAPRTRTVRWNLPGVVQDGRCRDALLTRRRFSTFGY
jgi:hypothetical protein